MTRPRSSGARDATRTPGRQRGFSLWEIAVLLGVLGLAIVAGFALLNAGQQKQIESDRLTLLAAADKAVSGFAARTGRLPCPDTVGDGSENCAAGVQKGWLPTAALGDLGADRALGLDVSAPERGILRVRYVVYRGAGAGGVDLANRAIPDRFNPSNWDKSQYTLGNLGVLDFCKGLSVAGAAAPAAGAAYVNGAGGGVINVAYALSEGGIDRDGDGSPFDALNANLAVPGLESPARAADANYDDRVLARSFSDLGFALDCAQTTRSLDAFGAAVDVYNEVDSQKQWAKDFAAILTAVNATKSAVSGVQTGMSIAAMSVSVTNIGVISAVLAADIASCVVLVGCFLIPIDTVALNFAIAAAVASGVAIAANATALALNVTATVKTGIVVGKANAALDPSSTDLNSLLPLMLQASNDAATTATTARAKATAARSDANAALAAYNASVTNLYAIAHQTDTTGAHDALLAAALTAWQTYTAASFAYDDASAIAGKKHDQADATAAAIPAAQTDYNTKQAAYLADPTDVTKQLLRDSSLDALNQLTAQAAQLALDAAALDATAATKLTDRDNKLTAYNTARDAAVNAYPDAYKPSIFCSIQNGSYPTLPLGLPCNFFFSSFATDAYTQYAIKNRGATQLETTATADEANAAAALQSYLDIQAAIAAANASGTGVPIVIWSDPTPFLNAADATGGMK
jgi:type II secretory pathway pseudopilin PulG